MIKLVLQWFAKTASEMAAYRHSIHMSKNEFDNASGKPKEEKQKKETDEEKIARITASNGNVKEIADGLKYNVYQVVDRKPELYTDNLTAEDAREVLVGFKLANEEKGLFSNGRKVLMVRVRKNKKRQ